MFLNMVSIKEQKQKGVETALVRSSHVMRLWHRPIVRDEQRWSPRRYVYIHKMTTGCNPGCHVLWHGITYPHRASTVALPIDYPFETARFHDVKHKALQSKRLSFNVRHTRLPFAGFSVCDNAKIMNLSESHKVLAVKNIPGKKAKHETWASSCKGDAICESCLYYQFVNKRFVLLSFWMSLTFPERDFFNLKSVGHEKQAKMRANASTCDISLYETHIR